MTVCSGWRKVLRDCLKLAPDELKNSTLASLATVRAQSPGGEGPCTVAHPAVRTVNLRGLTADRAGSPDVPDAELMRFVTDVRSDKADETRKNPRAELLMWFPEAQVQIRVAGTLTLTPGDATAFAQLAEFERLWFVWPAPGRPRDPASDNNAFPKTAPPSDAVPDSFAIAKMDPDFVETFDGSSDPYTKPFVRTWYTLNNQESSWTAKLVNP
jgi:pyridoxamine 5'-phosphate oxidase